jgi:hypothetical protein
MRSGTATGIIAYSFISATRHGRSVVASNLTALQNNNADKIDDGSVGEQKMQFDQWLASADLGWPVQRDHHKPVRA